ncbi:MAG: carbohydrate ABC transporter permease [Clostridia bacterium]|nr:carbohydrate ABC transporter permease [Clostridia bacterium]
MKGAYVSHHKIKLTAFDYILYTLMGIFSVVTLYPIYYALIGSLNEGQDFINGGIWLYPRVFTLSNYAVVLADARLWRSFVITVLKTGIGSLTGLAFTSTVAYAMSRRELKGRKFFHAINIFTMFFGGGLVPYFLVIVALGLYDSFLVYIIPSLYSVYNMIVISSFFHSIPNDLHEVAKIDGASEFTTFTRIYVPLSTPVLATVALWLAVGHWNGYFGTMVYTRGTDLMTLQYYLLKLIKESSMPEQGNLPSEMYEQVNSQTVSYSAMVIATVPVLMVYPFLQRFFTKGIAIGSLKG